MIIRRVCIFAHYDKNDYVDEYVYYYLKELLKIVDDLVFVTVSKIKKDDVDRLRNLNIKIIQRENIGYDFYSYKVGIDYLELDKHDELILCNDSVYGPFVSLENIFHTMLNQECDFWGITASESISYHLQSYFLVFKSSLLHSQSFKDFWNDVEILDDKTEIIKKYEVGLSQFLLKNNFHHSVYINNVKYTVTKSDNIKRLVKRVIKAPYKILKLILFPQQYWKALKKKNINVSLLYWDKLLLEQKMPFLKKSLFSNIHEKKENLKKLSMLKDSISTYPLILITNHIERIL